MCSYYHQRTFRQKQSHNIFSQVYLHTQRRREKSGIIVGYILTETYISMLKEGAGEESQTPYVCSGASSLALHPRAGGLVGSPCTVASFLGIVIEESSCRSRCKRILQENGRVPIMQ